MKIYNLLLIGLAIIISETSFSQKDKDDDTPDAILNETANILADFIVIPNQRIANF